MIGRGGGPFERHGNLTYLTGHYPSFPAIPDRPPFWRLRGHAAVVVGAGRTVLVTDDHLGEGSAVADEIRSTADLPAAIGAAARDAGLAGARVGIVGTDVLDAVHLAQVEEQLGGATAADDLLAAARMVKSPAEQELLRRAGRAGSAAITAAVDAALAGANEQEAAAEAVRVAMVHGAAIANTFTGVYGPGRPPRRHLYPSYADDAAVRPGDVFVIDMSGALDGYFFDFARSAVVGPDGHGGEEAIALAREIVETTVARLRPGTTVDEAVAAGRAVMERAGDEPDEGGFDALGHGLGLGSRSRGWSRATRPCWPRGCASRWRSSSSAVTCRELRARRADHGRRAGDPPPSRGRAEAGGLGLPAADELR